MKRLKAVIRIDQMRQYRVLGMDTMRQLGSAQHDLIIMVKALANSGKPPSHAALEDLMWRYAAAIRSIDFADKFLIVHGEPVRKAGSFEAMRRSLVREVCHWQLEGAA